VSGGLTLDTARRLIVAAEEEAKRRELRLSFAVVDAGGHVIAIARMDGAAWITTEIALGKAWTSAAFHLPSETQGKKAKDLVAFAGAITTATHGRYTPQIGGLPIQFDGETAGGMGASGASGDKDEAVVQAALDSVFGPG
jgi:glc operon protein GlcG